MLTESYKFLIKFFVYCWLIFSYPILQANWLPAQDFVPVNESNDSLFFYQQHEDEFALKSIANSLRASQLINNQETEQDNIQTKLANVSQEIEQFQLIKDPFGNQTVVWLSHGAVFASTKPVGADWQAIPDLLSSKDEIAGNLQLSADSMGNAFVIWQSMPNRSIHASIKIKNGSWQTEKLTEDDEIGTTPQIAASSDGRVIAIWKSSNEANVKMRFAEFYLPLALANENFHSSIENGELLDANQELFAFDQQKFFFNDSIPLNFASQLCKESIAQLPSTLPFPPTHLRGHQVANQFAAQTDLINIISWKPPFAGPAPIAYFIYRDRALTQLAAIVPADRELKFKDHNRLSHRTYSYFIVSVDAAGNHSPPSGIIFKGSKVHRIKIISPISITIIPVNPVIAVGETQQFLAVILFSDGSVQNLTSSVLNFASDHLKPNFTTAVLSSSSSSESSSSNSMLDIIWSSSNPTVATIDANGLATGLTPGITIISATIDGISSSTTLTVGTCTSPTITSPSTLPDGLVGTLYSTTLTATGTGPIAFSLLSGTLPPGLSLSSSGTINGTPTVAGTFNFTIQAVNGCGTNTQFFSISVTATCVPPTITSSSPLPDGLVGTLYSTTLTATGTAPIAFSLASGTLPPGLSINSSGTISGTPTVAGTFNFTIQALNACGNNTQLFSITVTATCVPPTITSSSPLPDGLVGTLYSTTLTATGTGPIAFSLLSGTLPPGLSLSSSGTISGTPTVAGTFNFTIQAVNGCNTVNKNFSLTIFLP